MDRKKIISAKCESCGSKLIYDPRQECLRCISCDSNYLMPEKDSSAVLTRQYNPKFKPNMLNKNLLAYRCEHCGNIQLMSNDVSSSRCLNCGGKNNVEIKEDFGLCADGIIPFKINKQQASEYFQKYLKKKWGIPKELKKDASNQKLMGVYIPVWNFTMNVSAVYQASVKVKSEDSFSKPVFGDRIKNIKSLDESANSNENDVFLDLFDEKDYAHIIPYTPEYTYGFRTDIVNKDIHQYYNKITERAKRDLEQEIKFTLNSKYEEVHDVTIKSKVEDVFFNFTYVPVYINTFKSKDKVYKTYISGTTGKVKGKSPKSFGFYFTKFVEILLALGAVGTALYFILTH